MFLVVVDTHSKLPEMIKMTSTTTEHTIEVLRTIFARLGLPEQLVSDNGPQFSSDEFAIVMRDNYITHKRGAPYHPSKNGSAERFVETFKKALKTSRSLSFQHRLDRFLLAYSNAPHAQTGQPPAVLLMGRRLRSRLDVLKPDLQRKVTARSPPNEKTVQA